MIETWKKNCSLKQLSLEHDEPITFVVSQWQREPKPSVVYLVYRWIVALFFFITFVLSIWDFKHPDADSSFKAKWLIYLTNWGYTTCTLQSLISAIILSICVLAPRLRSRPNLQSSTLKFYKLYWVLNVIATDIAFGITILYWSLIYDEKVMDFDAMNFFVHANNSVLMMIDLFVVAHPIRLLHCCYPVVFGICYAVFSVIFYAAGGISREGQVYIYNILDWRKPGTTTVICLAVLAFIVIVHISCWGLHKFRIWTHSKCLPEAGADCNGLNKEEKDTKGAYVNEGIANDMV
ncbi:protein rolling stone [Tribolium castaneum]|uniref:Protein rolling stone-like Protein n=1 Tax=Tribolium castaneum TaxID=7070 RepID=D6W7E7_TRICA|nr:PREDICTED: protein rolling stone [Tribolium castaneum]XP_008199598.1 PREDICTED: protein rolling stone [Tribolium castaneum]XP_015835642.1 PREDICTED: protein rolling stone [Tribolium castaneum]EFA11216.1 Protein rolling stone-like Protein [Tribolium castaneum]|eukprot:XP_008199587.1 PREDICTED: protein rolling stone [Tribolium castaneum]